MLRNKSRDLNRRIRLWRLNFEVCSSQISLAMIITPLTIHLANANAEQKARLLEAKVAENVGAIEQLRQERSLLVSDHKELQHRYSEISEVSWETSRDINKN